jgi:FixJ family two-component response regulator
MPGADGIEVAAALHRGLPHVRSLIVGRPGYRRRAVDAGASDSVVKDTPAAELADAVRRVNAGLRVIDPTLATENLATGSNPLTDRERDVLRSARGGATVAAQVHPCGHCRQPPVERHRQDRSRNPGRSSPGRPAARLVVMAGQGRFSRLYRNRRRLAISIRRGCREKMI